MTPEERNIRERLQKTLVVLPEPQAGICAVQREDIRSLLTIIDMLRAPSAAAPTPGEAA